MTIAAMAKADDTGLDSLLDAVHDDLDPALVGQGSRAEKDEGR